MGPERVRCVLFVQVSLSRLGHEHRGLGRIFFQLYQSLKRMILDLDPSLSAALEMVTPTFPICVERQKIIFYQVVGFRLMGLLWDSAAIPVFMSLPGVKSSRKSRLSWLLRARNL